MKLIIQIPCHNEADTLPLVFENMPREIPGIDEIEYLIIDDGSTDATADVARSLGVQYIVNIPGENRRWLGRAFRLGIDEALKQGADIIVNTDGDNQYPSTDIARLVAPILAKQADIVIGNRDPHRLKEFSFLKRVLQKLGNIAVSSTVRRRVPDAVSGFRAYSKDAAQQIHLVTNFTYTVDSLIQSYNKGLTIRWVPIVPNPKTRESRLIKNLFSKVIKSGTTIVRLGIAYQSFQVFALAALLFAVPGAFFVARFLYFYFFGPAEASGHGQSVVLGGVSLIIGLQVLFLGVLAEMLSINRQLLERILTKMKKQES